MREEKDPVDREQAAEERRRAYRTANRLMTSAGITLALAGVRPSAPEMEAIRRALRAVNIAGGIEQPRKEVVRVYPAGGRRFGRDVG
jgi:hypothetical protein